MYPKNTTWIFSSESKIIKQATQWCINCHLWEKLPSSPSSQKVSSIPNVFSFPGEVIGSSSPVPDWRVLVSALSLCLSGPRQSKPQPSHCWQIFIWFAFKEMKWCWFHKSQGNLTCSSVFIQFINVIIPESCLTQISPPCFSSLQFPFLA